MQIAFEVAMSGVMGVEKNFNLAPRPTKNSNSPPKKSPIKVAKIYPNGEEKRKKKNQQQQP